MSQPTIKPRTKTRDVQVADIGINTQVLRSRTWERLKFEVEYSRQRGTTSNSYLIKADKTALIDPPGRSFTQTYLEILSNHEWGKIDYIILQHVNPNRLATIQLIAGYAPQAKIICSQPAAKALKAALIFPEWKLRVVVVKDGDTLDLGQGHKLQFISAATPRWQDGLCTYDSHSQILFTDKFFGTHICNESIFDDRSQELNLERRFYFDCLHGSQTKELVEIIAKFKPLKAKIYAPAHGSLTKNSLSQFKDEYSFWCQQQSDRDLKVVLLSVSAYGNTHKIANAIALTLIQSGVAVELINYESASKAQITQAIRASDGFIIGSPKLASNSLELIESALESIFTKTIQTKLVGLFGSSNWSGEGFSILESKLRNTGCNFGFEPFRISSSLNINNIKECIQAGQKFNQKLQNSHRLRIIPPSVNSSQLDAIDHAV